MRRYFHRIVTALLCALLLLALLPACAQIDGPASTGSDDVQSSTGDDNYDYGYDDDDTDEEQVILSSDEYSDIINKLPDLPSNVDSETKQPTTSTDTGTQTGNTSGNSSGNSSGNDNPTQDDPPEPINHYIDGNETYASAAMGRQQKSDMGASLSLNGIPCTLDETSRTFCFAISESDVGVTDLFCFSGETSDGETLHYTVKGDLITEDAKYCPSANQTLELRCYTNRYYADYKLRISIVPIIRIETENRQPLPTGSDKTSRFFCTITVQDPDWESNDGKALFSSYATIRLRGASSLGYPKKPYKVELQKFKTDDKGNVVMTEDKESLLGMRKDDDWIFDALYGDPTLMHNYMAYGLWEEIGGDTNPNADLAGPHSKFVEVILNGQYNGVYLLVEPVDEKQMGVDKSENTADGSHGVFIKTTSWINTKFDTFTGHPYNSSKKVWVSTWEGFEMKYPETNVSEADWTPLLTLLDATVNGNDSKFKQTASKLLDRDNIINYWIFISVTLARDNAGKNICWSISNLSDPNAKMYINVWDCDNTFGYRYGKPAVKDPPTTKNYADDWFLLLRRYLENNVEASANYLEDRWEELTADGAPCSVSALHDRIDTTAAFLESSGAYSREQSRWPATGSVHASNPNPLSKEVEYAKQWITERIPIVDAIVKSYQ